MVNRTPITGEVHAHRGITAKSTLAISGCNIGGGNSLAMVFPKVGTRPVNIVVSILTPYMPITSSGKSPDLSYFAYAIVETIEKAAAKAIKAHPKGAVSRKSIVLANLMTAVDVVSVNRVHKYNQRMLYYHVRELVKAAEAGEMEYSNFTRMIDEYENVHGPLPGMVRDDRGSFYIPHQDRDKAMSLGQEMSEHCQLPEYTFNKVLYIEKEGFFHILIDEGWPERHDCCLLSSKGYASRAAKDLIDKIGVNREVIIFCMHDADASGTTIYQTLQGATIARGARNVEIVNIGLEPWEAVEMGLEPEPVERSTRKQPVADYVKERNDGYDWEEWLQEHRIELNAMTTVDVVDWLDGKMEEYDRVIPPAAVIDSTLRDEVQENLTSKITARILKEQDLAGQVSREFERLKPVIQQKSEELVDSIEDELTADPVQSWRGPVKRAANEVTDDGDSPE